MQTLELSIKNLTKSYLDKCQALERKYDCSTLQTILPIIKLKEEMFKELKVFILAHTFKDEQEEIHFFKQIKPQLFSKLIYYHRICHIISSRPVGSCIVYKNHLGKELDRIQHYFESNIDFYKYYRSGHSHFDGYYFLRRRPDIFHLNFESFYFERDPDFSSCYDFTVAKILAHDMLTAYINNELIRFDKDIKGGGGQEPSCPQMRHTWTGTKTELVELIYAIYTKCSIDNGNSVHPEPGSNSSL